MVKLVISTYFVFGQASFVVNDKIIIHFKLNSKSPEGVVRKWKACYMFQH